jgi:hypothetical protein
MVLFRHFSLVLGLVMAQQLLLQESPMIFASIWSRINQRFLFCLILPLTVCAMECSFLSCVSATAFMLRQQHLSLLIFFFVIKKLHVGTMFFFYTENKTLLESSNKNYLSQFQVMFYLNYANIC